MKDISEFTDRELQEELEHRKRIAIAPPQPIDNPNFEPLRQLIIDTIKDAIRIDILDQGFKKYVYEFALEAVYGPKFLTWFYQQKWEI